MFYLGVPACAHPGGALSSDCLRIRRVSVFRVAVDVLEGFHVQSFSGAVLRLGIG